MAVATVGHVAHVVSTSLHSSDGRSDISGPSLLALTVATGYLTSAVCCYWTASSDRLSNISGPLLLVCAVVMAQPPSASMMASDNGC
jgi:hypothetical protein